MRGAVLSRKVALPPGTPRLTVKVSADAGRGWEFTLLADNTELKRQLILGNKQPEWQTIEVDLSSLAGKEITLRLYQNVISSTLPCPPSAAHWKSVTLR
jgi:hypothetical protein